VETERIERDRNLKSVEETAKKLEAEMKNAEVRSQIDGISDKRSDNRWRTGFGRE